MSPTINVYDQRNWRSTGRSLCKSIPLQGRLPFSTSDLYPRLTTASSAANGGKKKELPFLSEVVRSLSLPSDKQKNIYSLCFNNGGSFFKYL